MAKNKSQLYRVELSYATFGVEVRNHRVYRSPPIARWMIGKEWNLIVSWIRRKKGRFEEIVDNEQ